MARRRPVSAWLHVRGVRSVASADRNSRPAPARRAGRRRRGGAIPTKSGRLRPIRWPPPGPGPVPGAALHYVNGRNGVKDFDVWSFYAQYDDWPFPARWRGTRDFGPSKFGRYPRDAPRYSGRRVDLLGRSLRVEPGADPADAIRRYLAGRRTRSAKELAARAVVLIDPEGRVGEIVWPGANHTG